MSSDAGPTEPAVTSEITGEPETAYDEASRLEAVEAVVHGHRHHPVDDNVGVTRVKVSGGAGLAGVLAALVMLAALIALGLAIGNA